MVSQDCGCTSNHLLDSQKISHNRMSFYVHVDCKNQMPHTNLRVHVRAFSHKTFWVYHVYSNFILGYMCRITVIFGTVKDGSLLIFLHQTIVTISYRNIFQNDVDVLSKIDDAVSIKRCRFYLIRIIR